MTSPVAASWFQLVYRTNLVYNQCWEDPARDQEALALGPDDRVLAITSAGCNVLDYALRGARVLAVDANPRQNHLLELKLAGIRMLSFEEWRHIFAAAAPGARIIFRSGAREVSFLPGAVREHLRFEHERALELHRRDRVGTYGSFHIAHVLA